MALTCRSRRKGVSDVGCAPGLTWIRKGWDGWLSPCPCIEAASRQYVHTPVVCVDPKYVIIRPVYVETGVLFVLRAPRERGNGRMLPAEFCFWWRHTLDPPKLVAYL
eukprot:scaffold75381_cov37-Tisochrysis_lutea.AAC.1